MRKTVSVGVVLAMALCGTVRADNESSLWGWNVSGGANFGFGLKTKLVNSSANALKALPKLHPDMGTKGREEAMKNSKPVPRGPRVDYGSDDGGAWYVDPASSWGEPDEYKHQTRNWRLPENHVDEDRTAFVMNGENWGEVISHSETLAGGVAGSDQDVSYGASVELSHALWISENNSWGLDIALGLTWMKAADCFKSGGIIARREATTQDGTAKVTIPAGCLNSGDMPEDDNTWGAAHYDGWEGSGRNEPLINLNRITVADGANPEKYYADTTYLHSHGDYEEWELAILLRPWYDINDWLCVHGAVGVGVTRSSFDYSMEAVCNGSTVYRSSEEFNEWNLYGIAGAGLLCRVWDFDISCDGLFRWCQQDMEINGRDVNGTIEKPWAVLRLGLSYAF